MANRKQFTDALSIDGWTNLYDALTDANYIGPGQPTGEITLVNMNATPCYIHYFDDATTAPNIGGTAQVETQTAVVTVVTAGNAKCVVTGAGISGSPVTVTFAVANNDTAAQVAGKARTALAANAAVAAVYTIGGTNADITLTQILKNGNDGTLNVTLEDVTSGGITDDVSSVNTTAGVHAGLDGLPISTDTAAAPSPAFTLESGRHLGSIWLYTTAATDVRVGVQQI